VTPVVAVINELKASDADLAVWFICDRGFETQTRQLLARADAEVRVEVISAGKLRRYHGVPLWRQLLDVPTVLANIRDVFKLTAGFFQSLRLLRRIKPDVVFTKGGFVCVPVGYAARVLGIPLVIHDSDAHPGLTNRLLAKHAAAIATGAPLSNYAYPRAITRYVGIPVDESFKPSTAAEQAAMKKLLGYDPQRPLVVVTGGGLGAIRVNEAMLACAKELSAIAQVVHLAGSKNADDVQARAPKTKYYEVLPFVDEKMSQLIRAADVVVTRAGATTLLELAAAEKPIIIIPNPHLTSGHQLKNAAVYADADAAVIVDESKLKSEPQLLMTAISHLLAHPQRRAQLSQAIGRLARPDAAKDVAAMVRRAIK